MQGRRSAGEDTEFAPLLPKLFQKLQTGSGSPAEIGEEYLEKMRRRVPKVCTIFLPMMPSQLLMLPGMVNAAESLCGILHCSTIGLAENVVCDLYQHNPG